MLMLQSMVCFIREAYIKRDRSRDWFIWDAVVIYNIISIIFSIMDFNPGSSPILSIVDGSDVVGEENVL